jgi:hypothetical protein
MNEFPMRNIIKSICVLVPNRYKTSQNCVACFAFRIDFKSKWLILVECIDYIKTVCYQLRCRFYIMKFMSGQFWQYSAPCTFKRTALSARCQLLKFKIPAPGSKSSQKRIPMRLRQFIFAKSEMRFWYGRRQNSSIDTTFELRQTERCLLKIMKQKVLLLPEIYLRRQCADLKPMVSTTTIKNWKWIRWAKLKTRKPISGAVRGAID